MANTFAARAFVGPFAFVCAFVCSFAWRVDALAAAPEANESQDLRRVSVEARSSAEDTCVAALLRRIVDDDTSIRGPQRLYVGPRRTERATAVVRVYWPQAHAILLIDPATVCGDDGLPATDIDPGWYRTKARIDLDTDVVATPEDIAGSTYLVDRAWADAVIAECLRSEPLTIVPTKKRRKR